MILYVCFVGWKDGWERERERGFPEIRENLNERKIVQDKDCI
jgi:hypothetical protein